MHFAVEKVSVQVVCKQNCNPWYLQFPQQHTIIHRWDFSSMETRNITSPIGSESGSGNQSARQQLTPGVTLVNRYNIQDVIGIGGMGSVYRARDLHFPNVVKLVAVK